MDYRFIYASRLAIGLCIIDNDAWLVSKFLPSRLVWEFVQNRMCTRLIVSWNHVQQVSDILNDKGYVFIY